MSGSPSVSSSPPSGVHSSFLNREDVLGKSVIGLDAKLVGVVKDLAISTEGKVAIRIDAAKDDRESEAEDLYVGADEILAIGEVVLLRHSSALAGRQASILASSPTASPPTSYPSTVLVPPAYPSSRDFTATSMSPPSSIANGRVCSRCNFLNSASSKFCIKCGNRLP
jgi:sporulation protein YlmC with PRC-barrel domain